LNLGLPNAGSSQHMDRVQLCARLRESGQPLG
jgi:hypothetical protein